ncbi:MAG: carbonic anhydrase [Patescibacteria group bacterium]
MNERPAFIFTNNSSPLVTKLQKNHLAENQLLNNCDIVSVAGAAKNIADPKETSDREFILRQIDISKRLHGINEVVLMNHTDCGAYGDRDAFSSSLEEKNRHAEDMKTAGAIIKQKHPDLDIRAVLVNIDKSGKIDFEAIS